ncbi:MAG: crosslink repair DNA glycosylase YcaQ family protein [Woeseiaceae bacterium]|nr:crosslink repair DNA glycosylase YcaQ family protein [Woeseiaceae bacterium]
MRRISLERARRIALAAQGFDRPRPQNAIDVRHIRKVIRQLGLLQLDFVNVLVPAHYLVLYSRLGSYARERLHDLVYRRREFIEHWAHEASIVPMELWPLLEYRRQDYRPYKGSPILKLKGKSKYLTEIIELIEKNGPVTSADCPSVSGPERRPGDWHRSLPRWALEWHFGAGRVAVAERLANFQRVYDLAERVIDAEYLEQQLSREDAQRRLLKLAARSCGIATLHDLADYYRMSPREAEPGIERLVQNGDLEPVEVESWDAPAYLATGARAPRNVRCASLLSPFDPLVWFRPRAERLFDFHYRIEIYVPAAKRRWGYYVLPFLLDDRIVARVDLKADRQSGQLQVLAAHKEPNIDEQRTAVHLAEELQALASWLDLDKVHVSRRGSFARKLGICVRAG